MNIIIVGCGKIGKCILSRLIKENHNVTVIDKNQTVVNEIADNYDVISICGNCTAYDTLIEAKANKADIFIATTNLDEINLLSSFIAKTMGAKYTVARVRDEDHNSKNFEFVREKLGISMTINPELYTAKHIYNLLQFPSATKVETFTSRCFEIAELTVKENSPLINVPLAELRKKYPYKFLISAILRDGEAIIPDGSVVLKPKDKIGLLSSFPETHKLLKLMDFDKKPIKNVLIVGAGRITNYLAELLLEGKNSVTVIEKNESRALEFSEAFDGKLTVVKGDGLNNGLLLEHGVNSVDAFLSLTGKDEQNFLTSYYAKSKNAGKVITKINNEAIIGVSENLGLETLVSTQSIIADVIASYVRALQSSEGSKIETLYTLMNGMIEASEFTVTPDFALTNIPLKNLKLKQNTIVAGIIRKGTSIIPGGDDVILPDDKVIIISKGQKVIDLFDCIKQK
ncbi:MAG: Trk system potassium transporter TrkA [Clostridia bacterium]|nr:Trk system potassium transporter TrkA [Clostridia bacterium]